MKKILNWLMTSNRWKHLVGGLCIGIAANDWYCAVYAGVLTASALEYKDKAHGSAWDWTDFGCTMAGVAVGHCIRIAL